MTPGPTFLWHAGARKVLRVDLQSRGSAGWSLVLRNTDMSKLAQLQAARRATDDTPAIEGDVLGREVLTAYAPVPPIGWTVFVELPMVEAYLPLYRAIERLLVLLTVL